MTSDQRATIVASASRDVPITAVAMHEKCFLTSRDEDRATDSDVVVMLCMLLVFGQKQ